MIHFFNASLSVGGFIPHGHCYLWKPGLVGLHLTSDALIALSYFSISITLIYLIRRIQVPFDGVFLAFGMFIAACGATHLMEVWTLWHPQYWLSGEIKAITAIASMATAIILPPLVPQVARLVNSANLSEERQRQLEVTNQELAAANTQIKQLDELKTRFFANVSHELRTPLTLILGFAERLLKQTDLSVAQRQAVSMVDGNARILLNYVNDLLDIARLEASKMDVRYTNLDLAKLVRETLSAFASLEQERQVHITITTPDAVPMQGDREKLRRVFLNLFSNAFKFVPVGGWVACEMVLDSDRVRVMVDDTGPGVPPELRQVIFERFQQGDRPSPREDGTGLGLAIVREFVELHQGHVMVTDAPGGGARFIVDLPLMAPAGQLVEHSPPPVVQPVSVLPPLFPVAASTPSPPVPSDPSRPLILAVEDNADMRLFIRESLEGEYRVVTAINGEEGLEKAIALRPDLILTDIKMPVMDGAQLVSCIQANDRLRSIPIVLLTAQSDATLKVDLLRQGAQDYIVKPFSVAELQARIHNLLLVKQVQEVLKQQLSQQEQDLDTLSGTTLKQSYELQNALLALRRSEARLRRLVEASMMGVIFWNVHGEICDANQAFLDLVGYTRDDLKHDRLQWTEMTPPEYRELDAWGLNKLREHGAFPPLEKEYIRKDGSRIPVLIGGVFLEDSQEEGVSFVLDITDRKRFEEERNRAEAALKAMNDELESRVEQRTSELFHTNLQLEQEIADRIRIEAALRVSQESMQSLYEIVAAPHLDFSGKIQALLTLGCRRFQLNLGILAEITGDRYQVMEVYTQATESGMASVPIQQGDTFPLGQTYCQKTLASKDPVSVEQAGASEEWRGHPCYLSTHLEAYIATAIWVGDRLYGTLNFSSLYPRQTVFTQEEKKFLQLMGQWIGGAVARQQAEARLRFSEARLNDAQRIAHLGSWSFDVQTQKLDWSEETFHIFGFPVTDRPPSLDVHQAQIHPDDLPRWGEIVNRAIAEGSPYQFDFRLYRPDGSLRYITARGEPSCNEQGEVTRLFGTVMDITDRKLAELEIYKLNAELENRVRERTAQLETANQQKDALLLREQAARAEAEAANRMKDEFLATLSHELRTPLNSILGWAQLLRTRPFDAATTQKALETIERNARSQNQLVADILDVSRIIRGQLHLNLMAVNVTALVRTSLESVRPTAEAKDIALHLLLPDDGLQDAVLQDAVLRDDRTLTLWGDPDRLQQVIWNLLSNAVKFTPQGGSVEVTLRCDRSDSIEIRVKDTGEGISPTFLPYVFDRFRQADGSMSRPHGGLGLGLAIVRHLIELHGGSVQAQSEGEGKGATFSVRLPLLGAPSSSLTAAVVSQGDRILEPAPGDELTSPALPSALLAGLTILAVDDEPDALDFLTTLLEQYGASVRVANSVASALQSLEENPLPHVLVSDIGMPGEDGYSLIRRVKTWLAAQSAELPTIALTAYASADDRDKLLQAGFNLHVAKPVDPTELMTAIATLVKRSV